MLLSQGINVEEGRATTHKGKYHGEQVLMLYEAC